ncbi:hypothetical protein [Candidatus Vondammii sp. HM_W22]|uniref:hypothetical protein n=1 Tax=Candidatus Vondammii sp. HM_W22 TaxID=2687299 RepID=UPI001F12B78B|nr:hypothetical protein [Candidatus Vondammii sp. HM_W22]
MDDLRWDAFRSEISGWSLPNTLWLLSRSRLWEHLQGTRGNRRYLKQHSTRFAGKLLGWSKKVAEANREELKPLKAQRHEAYLQRISVEGRFGREKTAID